MKRTMTAAIFVIVLTIGASSARPQEQQRDYGVQSVAVVRQFVALELRGERLTTIGWRSAGNKFFVKPEPASANNEIRVVSDKFYLSLTTLKQGPSSTVEASFPVCWGKIGHHLRFVATGADSPPGLEVLAKCSESYNLVFSGQDWELGSDGKVRPFTGTTNVQGMRIINFPQYITLNRAVAIRYVTEMRDKSTDPITKKNADKTIATLRKLRE